MHKKWAKDGLVILTLTIDDDSDNDKKCAKARADVEAFLAKVKPPFRTVRLAIDDKEKIPKTLYFGDGVPKGYVFNRENNYVLKMPVLQKDKEEDPFDYDVIEKTVSELMNKK